MVSIDEIREALNRQRYAPAPFTADSSHAAVAMITVDGVNELEVCFIRRAERDGDPWSGQVAFPGGRADPTDADAYAVAERETEEEIGILLSPSHRVGALPIRPIDRRGLRRSMTLSPFIYHLPATAKKIARPQDVNEVAGVFWVPMSHLFDERWVTDLDYPMAGATTTFPGIAYGDHVIWGLTLRILNSFAHVMGRSMPVAY